MKVLVLGFYWLDGTFLIVWRVAPDRVTLATRARLMRQYTHNTYNSKNVHNGEKIGTT